METAILRAFSSNSEINPPHHWQALQMEEHPALEETSAKMQNTHTALLLQRHAQVWHQQ